MGGSVTDSSGTLLTGSDADEARPTNVMIKGTRSHVAAIHPAAQRNRLAWSSADGDCGRTRAHHSPRQPANRLPRLLYVIVPTERESSIDAEYNVRRRLAEVVLWEVDRVTESNDGRSSTAQEDFARNLLVATVPCLRLDEPSAIQRLDGEHIISDLSNLALLETEKVSAAVEDVEKFLRRDHGQ